MWILLKPGIRDAAIVAVLLLTGCTAARDSSCKCPKPVAYDEATLKEIWQLLKPLETNRNPFHGAVEAANVHWVKPSRVAEIKFTEWTHETAEGGMKLRAPVFLGLREDKDPKECTLPAN